MFVSVKICDILEFVKRLFKVLTKFHGKNISTMGAGCILKNGDPTQFLIKMGTATKSFVYNNVRWKQKNKKNPSFAQARYLWTKLCIIFDEAFLFDVSIYPLVSNDLE